MKSSDLNAYTTTLCRRLSDYLDEVKRMIYECFIGKVDLSLMIEGVRKTTREAFDFLVENGFSTLTSETVMESEELEPQEPLRPAFRSIASALVKVRPDLIPVIMP